MTDSPHLEFKSSQATSFQDQTTAQVSQDIWLGKGTGNLIERKLDTADRINNIVEKALRSEDTTPGFARLDSHEGPGVISPASLRDNLLKSAKEQFSPEEQKKYDHEGYKPWLNQNDRNSDMSMHNAVHKLEKEMEQEVVKKAFGDLSITDQKLLSNESENAKSASESYSAAEKHLREAITFEAHKEIKARTE